MRQALRGFGLHVTDSGIRTGRSPLDVITAASRAKDAAAIDILRHELEALGERLRAVVVTDAAERSAPHRALDVLVGVDGAGSTDAAGGAVRCFNAILADTALRGLHPILLTSSHLRLAHGDDELLEHLRACTGLELPAHDDGWSLSATGGGVGSANLVLAVSGLVASGAVRLVVGTRGLLGEGWDCPAVNTLVDLTTVTTSTAVQQLRGRTLRLDPAWPGKVAHNWSVACLVPAGSGLRSTTDLDRLRRKADRLWAVVLPDPDASGDSDPGPGARPGPAPSPENPVHIATLEESHAHIRSHPHSRRPLRIQGEPVPRGGVPGGGRRGAPSPARRRRRRAAPGRRR